MNCSSLNNPKGENWMPTTNSAPSWFAAWDSAFNDTHISAALLPTEATEGPPMGYCIDSFAYSTLDNVDWLAAHENQGEDKAWQNVPIGVSLPRRTNLPSSQPLNCGCGSRKAQGANRHGEVHREATHATWLINHKAPLSDTRAAQTWSEKNKEANTLSGLHPEQRRTTEGLTPSPSKRNR